MSTLANTSEATEGIDRHVVTNGLGQAISPAAAAVLVEDWVKPDEEDYLRVPEGVEPHNAAVLMLKRAAGFLDVAHEPDKATEICNVVLREMECTPDVKSHGLWLLRLCEYVQVQASEGIEKASFGLLNALSIPPEGLGISLQTINRHKSALASCWLALKEPSRALQVLEGFEDDEKGSKKHRWSIRWKVDGIRAASHWELAQWANAEKYLEAILKNSSRPQGDDNRMRMWIWLAKIHRGVTQTVPKERMEWFQEENEWLAGQIKSAINNRKIDIAAIGRLQEQAAAMLPESKSQFPYRFVEMQLKQHKAKSLNRLETQHLTTALLSLRAGLERMLGAGFDKKVEAVPSSEDAMSSESNGNAATLVQPSEAVVDAFARLNSGGFETLSAADWKIIAKHSTQASKELAKSEAIATVQRLAHELFPELKADQRATANRLTKLFAKHGSDVIDDETKLQFVELTRAWKAAGGSLEYDGQAVRLDTISRDDSRQMSFQVLQSRKGRYPVVTSTALPAMTFIAE